MTNRPMKTGKELERRVANAYRQMGARKVEHDVELAGNQIDVYVELETPGRLSHRIAVEAKDWSKPVGIDVVNGFAAIVNLLHHERLIDEGIIVSAKGFSKQARNAAQIHGIRLLEPADLDAMVAEAKEAPREEVSNLESLGNTSAITDESSTDIVGFKDFGVMSLEQAVEMAHTTKSDVLEALRQAYRAELGEWVNSEQIRKNLGLGREQMNDIVLALWEQGFIEAKPLGDRALLRITADGVAVLKE
jgi:hypothetical protein